MGASGWDRVLGFALLVAALAHDGVALREGRAADCCWVCNVSALVLALGWVTRRPQLCAAGGIWLLPGTIVWLSDVWLANSNIIPTSYAVHLGGSALALLAPRRIGSAPKGWLWALGLLGFCVVFSRFFLSAAANVNAAHHIPKGWELLGSTRLQFVISATALSLVSALLLGFGLERLGRSSGSSQP
ncbi:MAG: hypothetical protein H6718_00615 [Polyangiaceae bacterium]|nr:hypothetical protein [Myxococcales bacterium]MCB9583865.1 hypothetical protein [Polyangiaceae bacterium]MCB9607879.1 hypothetical protein [Polyangiaceae bacterium]